MHDPHVGIGAQVSAGADVLATFPLFAAVGKRQLRKLVRSATFAELARGQSVFSWGAGTESLYVVLGGEARMLRPTPRSIRTGDYFGELGVLGWQHTCCTSSQRKSCI